MYGGPLSPQSGFLCCPLWWQGTPSRLPGLPYGALFHFASSSLIQEQIGPKAAGSVCHANSAQAVFSHSRYELPRLGSAGPQTPDSRIDSKSGPTPRGDAQDPQDRRMEGARPQGQDGQARPRELAPHSHWAQGSPHSGTPAPTFSHVSSLSQSTIWECCLHLPSTLPHPSRARELGAGGSDVCSGSTCDVPAPKLTARAPWAHPTSASGPPPAPPGI